MHIVLVIFGALLALVGVVFTAASAAGLRQQHLAGTSTAGPVVGISLGAVIALGGAALIVAGAQS